ncbi:MAG: hypothetical protein ACYCZF_10815 [Anaerolineae bacterium]
MRKGLYPIILALSLTGLLLTGCFQIPAFVHLATREESPQGQPTLVAPSDPNPDIIAVPADWTLYQARRLAFGFYYPPAWEVSSEGRSRVLLVGKHKESLILAIVESQCGLGVDDIPEEGILDCLATNGEAAASIGGEGYLHAKDWHLEQGRWVYTFSYIVSSEFSPSIRKQYLLACALPEHKMLIGLYEAPVIGPRTCSDLRLLMASFRSGQMTAQVVTPTALPTPSSNPATPQPRTTLPASVALPPVIIPSGWVESTCTGCGIIFFKPPAWDMLQEESDHILWKAPNDGLVLVGVAGSPCDLSEGADPERALACLAAFRSRQAPENADYELLDNGYYRESEGTFYWIEYQSSTPDDTRPVYGLVVYSLLPDNQMLSVEYASVSHLPDNAVRRDVRLVANSVRVGKALVVTATPSPQATPSPAPTSKATQEWLEPLQPANTGVSTGVPDAQ